MQQNKQRRRPVQARGHERAELILHTAQKMIGERGNDAVSMRQIAAAAGVPIGSVYQYYRDKNAVLLAIMEQYFEQINPAVAAILTPVRDMDELIVASDRALKRFIRFFDDDPALRNLWVCFQAVPELATLDARETYRQAQLMTDIIKRCLPDLRRSDIRPFALFYSNALSGLVRFALLIGDADSKAVIREGRAVLEMRLRALSRLAAQRAKQKRKR